MIGRQQLLDKQVLKPTEFCQLKLQKTTSKPIVRNLGKLESKFQPNTSINLNNPEELHTFHLSNHIEESVIISSKEDNQGIEPNITRETQIMNEGSRNRDSHSTNDNFD